VPLLLGPPCSDYYFLVHHLVHLDDRHLLAVSDFSASLQREQMFFFVKNQTPFSFSPNISGFASLSAEHTIRTFQAFFK
jgi:hypothetical protein